MSETDRTLLNAIKSHMWIVSSVVSLFAVAIVVVFVLVLRYVDLIEIARLIDAAKCTCTEKHTQIHEQNVNLAAGWDREDTIREELQRRWKNQHDSRGNRSVEGSD